MSVAAVVGVAGEVGVAGCARREWEPDDDQTGVFSVVEWGEDGRKDVVAVDV